MKKLICIVLCIAMAFTMLAACADDPAPTAPPAAPPPADETAADPPAPPPPAPVGDEVSYTLVIHYSTRDEREPVDWALEQLKQEFPHVTINPEAQINDDGVSMLSRIATGDVPDFFAISPNMIEPAINTNSILQLDDAVNASGIRDRMVQVSKEKQLVFTDGNIWCIPYMGTMVHLFFYNQRLFDENNITVPTNYPEFLEAVIAFNEIDIAPLPIFAVEAWPIGAFFDMFAMRADPEGMLALNNGTASASDPGFTRAIEKMAEIIDAGVFQMGATTFDYDAARSIFHEGRAPMFINGEWDVSEIVDALGDDAGFLDIFPTTDPGNESANAGYMPGAAEIGGLAIAADIENPELAKEVAMRLAELLSHGYFVKVGRIDGAFMTGDLQTEVPMSNMAMQLRAAKEDYQVIGTVAHSLPNQRFAVGFGESLQKLVAGQSAADFIREVDLLFENTR